MVGFVMTFIQGANLEELLLWWYTLFSTNVLLAWSVSNPVFMYYLSSHTL